MKKRNLFAAVMLCALSTPVFTSCGDDDPVTTQNNNGNNNPTPTNTVLSTTEQKEYLEDVGIEFVRKIKANDFRHYKDLAEYLDETYSDYDTDDINEWASDTWEALRGSSIGTSTERESEDYGGNTYTYVYHYTDFKAVILASNFTGRWEARDGKWNRTDAADLSFVCKNQNGQECVLRLTTSGTVTRVHLYDETEWTDYEYEGGVSNEYYDRTQYTIGVPQNITLTLTEGGTTLLSNVISINLSGISNEEFDLSRSAFTASCTTTLNNGYTIKTDNLAYTSSSVTAQFTFIKNGETLLTSTTSCGLKNIPSVTLTKLYDMDDDELDDLFRNTDGSVNAFSIDVLGKVQLKGSLTGIRQLVDDFEAADDDEENESRFKQDVNNINSHIRAEIFYNGGATKQGEFVFLPFEDKWGSYSEWYMEPGIRFPDGSSYTLDKFFNEDDFKDLIDAFENLGEDFDNL